MSNIVERLTENIVERDLQKEGAALLNKWEGTGLLEGLDCDTSRTNMSRLLENQAKELLREASSMAAGDVEGFAAVAFPIVRRVFGGLIANQLVSVQPMSLPSGLIFFLDFTFTDNRFGNEVGEGEAFSVQKNTSLYGGNVVGAQITGGVNLSGSQDYSEPGGFYNLMNGYSSPTGTITPTVAVGFNETAISALTDAQKRALKYDPDILGETSTHKVGSIVATLTAAQMAKVNTRNMIACNLTGPTGSRLAGASGATEAKLLRRLTHVGTLGTSADWNNVSNVGTKITFYTIGNSNSNDVSDIVTENLELHYPEKDTFAASDTLGAVTGADPWGLELAGQGNANDGRTGQNVDIPEIDIKVDSIAVTAVTKKLKAKWSPELGQDLNAYHNLDAEVELTGILSEQIALEIDREILNDLVQGATAGTLHWSRRPGQFLNRETGASITSNTAPPDFTGTVSEWYETLLETINDVSARIHRKTLRGGANFLVCGPELASVLEMTSGFRASVTVDDSTGTAGAVKVGSVNKKWDIYVDPYFLRQIILVGRKGSSFLESGFVYAPYVPLQVTPTIFGTEDFVPRKGVMTRYAKKMVRPDMYGLVIVQNLIS